MTDSWIEAAAVEIHRWVEFDRHKIPGWPDEGLSVQEMAVEIIRRHFSPEQPDGATYRRVLFLPPQIRPVYPVEDGL